MASPIRSQRIQNDTCFHCRNQGHWAKDCPFKTPTKSPNRTQNPSPSSSDLSKCPSIPCPYGHGSCYVKTSKTSANPGRFFYSCNDSSPSGKCNFFMWFDQVKEFETESNVNVKRDRSLGVPDCRCRAGKCNVVKQNGRDYFVCPIAKGHGACNFRRDVEEKDATTPVLLGENGENQAGRLSPKRTKLASPVVDNPCTTSTPVDHIKETVFESEECDDVIDSSETSEMAQPGGVGAFTKEKDLQVSRFGSQQAVHQRQAEFLRQISVADDVINDADSAKQFLGTLISGWLGRLAFPPSGGLTVHQAKPFFCCVFPSYDPISVPKIVDCGLSKDLLHSSCNVQPDLSQQISSHDSHTGVLSELTSLQNVPGIRQGRDFMTQISKALLEAGLHVQNQLLAILESTDPSNHKSMEEAANKTFAVLNLLSVDYTSFSEHVRNFISCAMSLAKIEESIKGTSSSEEIMEQYKTAKTNFDTLSRVHSETTDAITASDQRLKLLGEEAALLKEMLLQTENKQRRYETENVELKTRSGKISEYLLESGKKLQDAEAAKKLHDEDEAQHNVAKEALESAKVQLRNSVIML